MENLVKITSKFLDKSGRIFLNLEVISRYKGSKAENASNTNDKGFFVFQASPNRTIELLAKPPNEPNYTVFKTISSSIFSSESSPITVFLPKTIEDYKLQGSQRVVRGIVSNFFQIVDSSGKAMANFPLQSRPKGGKSFERVTNSLGIVEVQSSPDREIEILVLNSKDKFILKSQINSRDGSKQPILIRLEEPYENFKSSSIITLLDRDGSDYVIEKTNVEMLVIDTGEKKIYSTSNAKLLLGGMVGQRLQFTVFKPDGNALSPVYYTIKRVSGGEIKLHLDVDITKGSTAQNEPNINKILKIGECTCDRDITIEEFKKVTSSSIAQQFLKDLNEQFKKLNMNSCLEKAHFIAHTLHETGGYRLMEEGLGGKPESSVYDGYKGRGLMQITYKSNYEKYGLAVNENFLENNKYRIAKEKNHAVGSAVWYWHNSKAGNLTPYALRNDLIATCALINGGYNGFDDRLEYYKKSVDAFNIRKCKNLENELINTLDSYRVFEESYIYSKKSGESFGWGLWNDPKSGKNGKTKDIVEAKKGYSRFLEMYEDQEFPFGFTKDKNGNRVSRKRYGYSANTAKEFAQKRLKEL